MPAPSLSAVSPAGRSDGRWIGFLIASFALGLAITWQRWGNPLIDCPREMNQPLRLLRGESLYTDVRHLYGPLAPHLNAALYALFGPSLGVLYTAGAISTAAVLALIYRIARRFVAPGPAAAATSMALWTCALNPYGTFVLPYAYASTYGCLLGIVTLELVLCFVEQRNPTLLAAAGLTAGLAMLAKTEMGLAAVATGILAISLADRKQARWPSLLLRFAIPATAVIVLGYAPIVARVGWRTLAHQTFILPLPGTLPPELVYFNRLISGLSEPLANLYRTVLGLARIALLGGFIVLVGRLLPRAIELRPRIRIDPLPAGLVVLMVAALAILRLSSVSRWLHWGEGIFRGLPLVLGGVLAVLARRWRAETRKEGLTAETTGLIVVSAYAAGSLARIPLRAATDTVYAATLFPTSIIVLAWLATSVPHALLREPRERRAAGHLATAVLFGYALSGAAADVRVYRMQQLGTIRTERGAMKAMPDMAEAFNGAIAFVLAETRAGEPVAVVPEGTSINFLTDRPNPLREESIHPGLLDIEAEQGAIARLEARAVRLVLIANRPTWMYGKKAFGADYCTHLKAWIDEKFEPVATFGPGATATASLGDRTFFIRAYRRKDARS